MCSLIWARSLCGTLSLLALPEVGMGTSVFVENNVNIKLLQMQKRSEVPAVPIDAHLTTKFLLGRPTIWRENRRVDLFQSLTHLGHDCRLCFTDVRMLAYAANDIEYVVLSTTFAYLADLPMSFVRSYRHPCRQSAVTAQ